MRRQEQCDTTAGTYNNHNHNHHHNKPPQPQRGVWCGGGFEGTQTSVGSGQMWTVRLRRFSSSSQPSMTCARQSSPSRRRRRHHHHENNNNTQSDTQTHALKQQRNRERERETHTHKRESRTERVWVWPLCGRRRGPPKCSSSVTASCLVAAVDPRIVCTGAQSDPPPSHFI